MKAKISEIFILIFSFLSLCLLAIIHAIYGVMKSMKWDDEDLYKKFGGCDLHDIKLVLIQLCKQFVKMMANIRQPSAEISLFVTRGKHGFTSPPTLMDGGMLPWYTHMTPSPLSSFSKYIYKESFTIFLIATYFKI